MPLKAPMKNYQIYVSEQAWRAYPKYKRNDFLKGFQPELKVPQPSARLRTRRCLRLDEETAAKLEVICQLNDIRNPWLPTKIGTTYGNGRVGLAVEAIGQALFKGELD